MRSGELRMPPLSIWGQWDTWEALTQFRAYIEHSPIFAYYERPLIMALWGGWPWLHLVITAVFLFFASTVIRAASKYKQYHGDEPMGTVGFIWTYIGLAVFLLTVTIAGAHYDTFSAQRRANPTLIPNALPARPIHPNSRPHTLGVNIEVGDPRYFVSGPRVEALRTMHIKSRELRTALDFVIILTPIGLLCIVIIAAHVRHFIFALSYAREIARPHLPTEIVDRALSGGRIDQHALANAFTKSTAPVVHDSLADKVERERLAALAARLQTDTSALGNKLSKETEIARLVVDHARKRAELADMEKTLREMGVKRNG